jgi:CheY-like chemotaxis protein
MAITNTTKMRVLIAEDDCDIAASYKLALEERGHKVTLTNNGEDCLIKYNEELQSVRERANSPESDSIYRFHPFHAVILDYKMPKIDGMEVAKEILAINSHQRIIFASAYVKETLEDAVRQLNHTTELMQKPFGEQQLIDVIEDKQIYDELKKLNVDADAFMTVSPPHELITDLLQRIKELQKGRHPKEKM